MKKITLLTLLTVSVFKVFAQDIIIKNDKTEVKAKIEELTETTIKYKKFEMLDGPSYNINKRDVFMIIYKNGTKEYIESSLAVSQQGTIATNTQRAETVKNPIMNNPQSVPSQSNSGYNNNNGNYFSEEKALEIKGNRYYYQGRKIASWKQLKGVFEENNVQESVDLMTKRANQYWTGVALFGISTVSWLASGSLNSYGPQRPGLRTVSFLSLVSGGVILLISGNKPKKAVEFYNTKFDPNKRVSLTPLIKSDMLGQHVGVSIGF
jgi:hypothetical protein